MKRAVVAVLLALISTSLVAQPRNLAPLRSVSVVRSGVTTNRTFLGAAAWNGSEHLVVWNDERGVIRTATERRPFTHGQAMRISADGMRRQPIVLPHRFNPTGVVWTGSYWIVLGVYTSGDCPASCVGGVRIDGDGVLLDPQVKQIAPFSDIFFGIAHGEAVWTGSHIIMGVLAPGYRASAVVLNEELEVTATHVLAAVDSEIVGVASDGQTTLLAYRTSIETRAAVFDAEGRLLKHDTLLRHTDETGLPRALTAGGGRYMLAFLGTPAADSHRVSLFSVSADLKLQAHGVATFASTQAFDEAYDGGAELVFDGARYNFFTTAGPREFPPQFVYLAQFDANGAALTAAAVPLLELDTSRGEPYFTVSQGDASTLFLAMEGGPLSARVAPAAEELPGVPKQRLELGAFQQESPAAAGHAQQSLVAWLEQTDPTAPPALFATRIDPAGNVLDRNSLRLGETPCSSRPGVASNGNGFVAAWHDQSGLNAIRIAADGSLGTRHTLPLIPDCAAVTLVGNGTDYLAVWAVASQGPATSRIYAARLRGDGSFIAPAALNVAAGQTYEVYVASDGRDYLLAWDGRAVRITASGVILDSTAPLNLGSGRVRFLWWNGTAYVAAIVDGDDDTHKTGVVSGGEWRFVRVDPAGQVTPSNGAPLRFPELGTFALPFAAACDSAGCTLPLSTTRDRRFGLTLLRLEDDGTNVTASTTVVPNYALPAPDAVEWPLPAGLLDAGRPVAVVHQMRTDEPYRGVHRVFVAPFGAGRARAVRH